MEKKRKTVKRKTNFERLVEEIPDIEEHISEDKVKVIKVRPDSKIPSENDYYKAPSKLENLKKHKGNYGIIIGYNHKKFNKSLAIIDIDGYSLEKGSKNFKEVKYKTKEYIFNCLKNIPNCLAVRTASGGYHIYLWNETIVDNFHNISKALTFPSDFEIEELQGKSLGHSIEIFTKEGSKQVVLPSSSIYSHAMEQDYFYKVISDVNKLSDIATVNNIHEVVKETMLAANYGYDESLVNGSNRRKKRRSSNRRKSSGQKKLKKLSDNEIAKVVELTVPVFKAIEGSKHEGTLALGGFFSYHISKNSSRKIATGIVKEIGSIFEDSEAFKKTLLVSYERPIEEKAGLPTLLDLIESLDSTFNISNFSEELNLICNRNFRKEKVATATINKNKVPVYLYENDFYKWLKYEGILEGIDLTLNFNTLIGSFIYSKTGKEIDSFKFKFNNKYLEIAKFNELKEFLESEEIILPEYFEKQLRRSIKSLDKSIVKPKPKAKEEPNVIEAADIPEENIIQFGITEEGFYSQSEEAGIEYHTIYYKNNEPELKTTPIANTYIKDVKIVLDSLGILEPVYNVTYYNKTFKKEVAVEYLTKKQLTEEFIKANVFYSSTKENVETVLNAFIIDGTKKDRITVKTEAYLEGYFIVNNHVVSNTKLANIKTPNKEELAEAITLLNNIMEDRTEEGKANDSTVYRFMLWNPFSYCLKQLGYSKANYSLILIGASQTNKTGSTKIGNLFYNRNEEETSGSTVSVLGSKIGENSFSSIFDECSHLFNIPEALNVMKRAVYEKTGRAVKDRNDNNKIDEFIALNLPIFILNPEGIKFKDFIINRYKIVNYSLESFLTEAAIEKFNKKYVPEAPDTILKKLALIGKVFSAKFIKVLEDPTERPKLFDVEKLTIEILKEMQEEAGVKFNKAMLKETTASTKYNYNVLAEIPKILSNEFKQKNFKRSDETYSGFTFVNSVTNNDFDFITYNRNRTEKTKDKEFIVNTSKLHDFINNKVEEYVELETILEALDLTEILKAKPDYKEPYSKYIKKQHKIRIKEPSGKVKEKSISGIYLTVEELANKLFSFNIDFSTPEEANVVELKPEKVET